MAKAPAAAKVPLRAEREVCWDRAAPPKGTLHTSKRSISAATALGRLQGCSWER